MRFFSRRRFKIFLVLFGLMVFSSLLVFAQAGDKTKADKYIGIGEKAFKKGDIKAAQKYFTAAQKAASGYEKPYTKLAELNLYYQNKKRAIEIYKEAIKNIPKNPSLHLRLGSIYYDNKQYDEALEQLKIAKELAPGAAKIYLYMGLSHFEKSEPDKAAENLKVFLEIEDIEEEDKILAQKTLADLLMEKKDWKNAEKYYKYVMDNPKASQALRISSENGYKRAHSQASAPKKGVIYGVIAFIAAILLYVAYGYIKKQQGAAGGKKAKKSPREAASYDELGSITTENLASLTRLPRSLIYFVKREGAPLYLADAKELDKKDFKDLEVRWEDLSNWISQNRGEPFIYKTEEKDPLFKRAFPNGPARLAPSEPRVGVVFIAENHFRGIAFLGSPTVKDMAGLKRYFEKNVVLIKRFSNEVGLQADRIFQKEMTTKDTITSAFSGYHFRERLPRDISRCRETRRSLTLSIFEIDKMMAIIKRFGEERKNYILKTLVTAIQDKLLKKNDSIYRVSDCTFAVIMAGTSKSKAMEKAKRLVNIITGTQFTSPIPNMTASIGMAIFPDQGADAGEVEAAARKALDKAISLGRSKLVIGDEVLNVKEGADEENLLKQAISTITIPKEEIDNITAGIAAGESYKTNVPGKTSSGEISLDSILAKSTPQQAEDSMKTSIQAPSEESSSDSLVEDLGTSTSSLSKKPQKQITFRSAKKTSPTPRRESLGPEDLGAVPPEEVTHKKYVKKVSDKVKQEINRARTKSDSGRLILRRGAKKESSGSLEKPEPAKTPPVAAPPPWLQEQAKKSSKRKEEKSETSLLRRPPKMREVGSSTSSLPELPKSAEVKRPMSGLIRRSKSSVQVPEMKRRTISTAFKKADSKKPEVKEAPSIVDKSQKDRQSEAVKKSSQEMAPVKPVVENKADLKPPQIKPKTVSVPSIEPKKPLLKDILKGAGISGVKTQKFSIKKEEKPSDEKKPLKITKPKFKSKMPVMPKRFNVDTSSLARTGMRPSRQDKTPAESAPATTPMKSNKISVPFKKVAPKREIPTDPVTGFHYKQYFEQSLRRLFIRSNQTKRPLALLFMKLDKHKQMKIKYGNDKLNNVLKEISQMSLSFLKEDSDVPCRYSEEIFVLILPDTSFQIAFNLAEQIRFTVGNLNFKDIPGQITMSLGISSFPNKSKSAKELMKTAYDSMVYAIKAGGNQSLVWDQDLPKKMTQ